MNELKEVGFGSGCRFKRIIYFLWLPKGRDLCIRDAPRQQRIMYNLQTRCWKHLQATATRRRHFSFNVANDLEPKFSRTAVDSL